MSSSAVEDGVAVRRSKRLMGDEPEYESFVDPEQNTRTPSNLSPVLNSRSLPKKSKEIKPPKLDHLSKMNDHNCRQNERQTYVSSFHGEVTRSQNAELRTIQKMNERNGEGPSGDKETQCHLSQTFIAKSSNPASVQTDYLHMKNYLIFLWCCSCILCAGFFLEWFCNENRYPTFDSVSEQFPHQSDNLWGFVLHGMESSEPFVLLLVHENQDDLATCLANHIAGIVVQSRTKRPADLIEIDGSQEKDHKMFQTLRSQMENRRAMVLLHLEHLPTNVADFLHFVLDVHEPWVPGGVYVLTLNLPNHYGNSQTAYAGVESFLKEKWPSDDKDDFPALIARISNFEYVVQKGSHPC